jgi:hypothetical protein
MSEVVAQATRRLAVGILEVAGAGEAVVAGSVGALFFAPQGGILGSVKIKDMDESAGKAASTDGVSHSTPGDPNQEPDDPDKDDKAVDRNGFVKDRSTKDTKNFSARFRSEREAWT